LQGICYSEVLPVQTVRLLTGRFWILVHFKEVALLRLNIK
jgi:hypothetical protein